MPVARQLRSTSRTITAALLLTAFGCSEPLAPSDVAGTYVLQRVAADPLPTELYRNESVVVRVISDTIQLRANGTGEISGVREVGPLNDVKVLGHAASQTVDVNFRLVDGRIEITYVCPINASCIEGPHLVARLAADGLRVDYALGTRVPLFYTRVPHSP